MPNPCKLCKSWVRCGLPAHLAAHTSWVGQHCCPSSGSPQWMKPPLLPSMVQLHPLSQEQRAPSSCGVTVRAEASSPEAPPLPSTISRAPVDVLPEPSEESGKSWTELRTTPLAAWGQWPQMPATAVGSKYEAWDWILPPHLPSADLWCSGERSHYSKALLNYLGSQNVTTWGVRSHINF